MNRILIILLVVALVVGGYMYYQRHNPNSASYNGEVVSNLASNDQSHTGATDLDGKPISNDQSVSDQGEGGGAATNQPPLSEKAPIATQTSATVAGPGTAPPANDTIAPNPPNGLAFAGTGKYQWYRQGNLTWRVDTGNGASCIAFATMEEWRKPIVYTHGCGNA